jgi:WD40 repeat protein
LLLWDPDDRIQLTVLTRHHTGRIKVYTIAFRPETWRLDLAAGYSNGGICLWDAEAARPIRTFGECEPSVLAMAYSPDGRTLAAGHTHGRASLWDIASGKNKGSLVEP